MSTLYLLKIQGHVDYGLSKGHFIKQNKESVKFTKILNEIKQNETITKLTLWKISRATTMEH